MERPQFIKIKSIRAREIIQWAIMHTGDPGLTASIANTPNTVGSAPCQVLLPILLVFPNGLTLSIEV